MSPQLKTETAERLLLTSEQLEDVRTVVSAPAADWTRISPALFAAYRLRALLQATEPAEEAVRADGDCFAVCEGHPLGMTMAHIHHHDIEAHAASFNEGYAEAVRQFTEPVDGIRNFPRCGHYLDEARCTRRIHDGDHESVQGGEVIVWPAGEPDPEPDGEERCDFYAETERGDALQCKRRDGHTAHHHIDPGPERLRRPDGHSNPEGVTEMSAD